MNLKNHVARVLHSKIKAFDVQNTCRNNGFYWLMKIEWLHLLTSWEYPTKNMFVFFVHKCSIKIENLCIYLSKKIGEWWYSKDLKLREITVCYLYFLLKKCYGKTFPNKHPLLRKSVAKGEEILWKKFEAIFASEEKMLLSKVRVTRTIKSRQKLFISSLK